MSLKGTEREIPLRDIPKVRKAVADRNVDVLAKYVESGAISTEIYNQLMEDFRANPNKPAKDKKVKDLSKLIKGILSIAILFVSMLCGLAYLIEQYGKGAAVWYIFLWLWAISHALTS